MNNIPRIPRLSYLLQRPILCLEQLFLMHSLSLIVDVRSQLWFFLEKHDRERPVRYVHFQYQVHSKLKNQLLDKQ